MIDSVGAAGDLRPKLAEIRDQIGEAHRQIWIGYDVPRQRQLPTSKQMLC